MNNGRDFAELDKALREQQRKKAVTKAAKKPAMTSRGRYMDMVHPRSQVRPPARSFSASKPTSLPKPSPRPALKYKTTEKTMEPTRKIAAPKVTEARGVAKRSDAVAFDPAREEVVAPKSMMGGEFEETGVGRPNLFSEDDDMDMAEDKSPDANNYSLGGRSPFLLADAKVDKRPLGPNVPESNAGAIRSTKNVYSQRTPLKAGGSEMPGRSVITVAAPKKKSGWLWAVITVGIIAAGGGIGLLAYAIFAG